MSLPGLFVLALALALEPESLPLFLSLEAGVGGEGVGALLGVALELLLLLLLLPLLAEGDALAPAAFTLCRNALRAMVREANVDAGCWCLSHRIVL